MTLPDITGYNFVAALLLTGETQTCGHSLALVKCSNGKLLLVNDTAVSLSHHFLVNHVSIPFTHLIFWFSASEKVVYSFNDF